MKHIPIMGAVALAATLGLTACEDTNEPPDEITIADFAGTWDASVLTFSPTTSGSTSNPVPFVALGGDLVVTITSTGSFSGILTVPSAVTGGDPADLPVAGAMTLVSLDGQAGNEAIDVDFDAATEAVFQQAGLPFEDFDGPFALSGSELTITNETTFDFDFGGPGAEEPALLTLTMSRTST